MSSTRRKKPFRREYGHRPYVSDEEYPDAMRRITDKAVFDKVVQKHSEFKKPYRSKTYQEMEHYYPTPAIKGGYPDYIGDSPFIPPNADMVDPAIIADAEKYLGLVYCFMDACYCAGQATCYAISCTYPLVSASASNPDVGVSFSQNEICFDVSAGVSGSFWLDLTLKVGKNMTKAATPISISECLPSECCGCTDISIGYTTQQMQVNEQQTLIVIGAQEGCTYNWAIASGGGSLSTDTGTSTIYTAPSTNAECANNPTITLSNGGIQCDVLELAVNAWVAGGLAARYCCSFWYAGNWRHCWQTVGCDGIYDLVCEPLCVTMGCTTSIWSCMFGADYGTCADHLPPYEEGVKDLRTAAMKTGGCCPWELL